MGSSPLARGLRGRENSGGRRERIIPARAGFTPVGRYAGPAGPDHPRSRGVYSRPSGGAVRPRGSSPLARGLRCPSWSCLAVEGIIPARAGFTLPFVELPGGRRDHPRSRGVYEWVADRGRQRRGSSPLARGLPLAAHGGRPGVRIIPARAGFTWSTRPGLWSPPDHPRSRGVYTIIVRTPYHPDGSSPLARGLRRGGCSECLIGGIIPARAGFTSLTAAAVRP